MPIEDIIKEKGLRSPHLTIQEKVDTVLDYLWDIFWINKDTTPEDKRFVLYAQTHPDSIKDDIDTIVTIAAKIRSAKSCDLAESKRELESYLNQLPPLSKEKASFSKGEAEAVKGMDRYFGNPGRSQYSGDDILQLGFLPHSCTSFSILAGDILKKVGVTCYVVRLEKQRTRIAHTILVYQIEDGRWLKCDPKWQRHPKFFRNAPELRKRFVTDPYCWIHGIQGKGGRRTYTSARVLR